MGIIKGHILCPECNEGLNVYVKTVKNSLVRSYFKYDKCTCHNCKTVIDLKNMQECFFLFLDYEDALCSSNQEIEKILDSIERIEEALGSNPLTEIRTMVLVLKQLKVNNEQRISMYITLLDRLEDSIIYLKNILPKTIGFPSNVYKEFKEDFYAPTNFINKKRGNIIVGEYLLNYLYMCLHTVIKDVYTYFEIDKGAHTGFWLENRKELYKYLYSIERNVMDILKEYKFITWIEELEIVDLLLELTTSICETFRNSTTGAIFGVAASEKDWYIRQYDTVLKPWQKELVFKFQPEKLFSAEFIIDRANCINGTIYNQEEWEERLYKMVNTSIDKEVRLIRNCFIKGLAEIHNIKLTKRDLETINM